MSTTADRSASRGVPGIILRAAEPLLMVTGICGIGLFAWSIVDIVRIESAPGAALTTAATREVPAGAWPGVFLLFGSVLALRVVRSLRGRGAGNADSAPEGALSSHVGDTDVTTATTDA